MRWSLRLGSLAGVPLYVHWTFVILLVWIAGKQFLDNRDVLVALSAVGFVLAIFGCVVLHELGHALMARRFGIRTRDITLLPIGGLARLERMPEQPSQELLVAVAGPAVNVAIAAVLVPILLLRGDLAGILEVSPEQLARADRFFLVKLMWVNVMLVLFNMIPAFPMDGGRVLRALLAMGTSYAQATRVAAIVGQILAIGFGLLGLMFGNFLLMLIAIFVFLGAQAEASLAITRSAVNGVPVRDAMITKFQALTRDETLRSVAQRVVAGEQKDFPVVEGEVIGVFTRDDLLKGLAEGAADRSVGERMHEWGAADACEMLDAVLDRMRAQGVTMLPVVHRGELVGIVTLENISEWIMIRNAESRAGGQSR